MSDRRAGKIFKVVWDEWCESCAKDNLDPWAEFENGGGEMSFDLGGGDSFSIQLIGEPPVKENPNE